MKTKSAAIEAALAGEVEPEAIDFLTDDSHWHAHVAGGHRNVLLVIAMRSDGGRRFGIFSSIATARAWAREVDAWAGEDGTIVTAPFIVDCPEYGEVEAGTRN